MEKSTTPEDDLKKRHRMEINSTILLSVAALAITWCSYQNTLWSGIQSFRLASASTNSRAALQQTLVTGQHQAVDAAVIVTFMNAVVDKDKDKVDFYLQRARPHMRGVLTEWLATDPLNNAKAPPHPLLMPTYTKSISNAYDSIIALKNRADQFWKEAEAANRNSDRYVLLTVILSIVMFLGAVAPKLVYLKLARLLNLISILILTGVLIVLYLYMQPAPGK